MSTITADVPVKILSTMNLREHWAARAARHREHRRSAYFALRAASRGRPLLPVVVRITRIGPRALDDDNLRAGCKALRDGVADWLGVDDAHPLVRWDYAQERGKPREYVARVQITPVEAA